AGMGHIVVMDDSEAQFALTRSSQLLWQALLPELSPQARKEIEYTPSGTLWVAADEEEMQEVRRKHAYYGARRVATEILDSAALAAAEPNLRPGLAGALLVPGDAVVYPPSAARWLLERAGVVLRLGAAVASIGHGRAALADGAVLSAGVIVNACGAASPRLTPGLPIRPRKGHLLITDRYPGWLRHQLVELGYLKSAHASDGDSVAFNAQPRATGQILIGSSRQFEKTHGEIDHAMLGRMLRRAEEYMPALGALSAIRAWTGFRAATPDSLPLIGRASADPTVVLATGHEGLGITTSLATGALVVASLSGAA